MSRYRNGLVSQLELLDARRSELRNRRAGAAGAVGAVPGDRRAGARAGRRLGERDMNQRNEGTTAVVGLMVLAVALVVMLVA